MLTLYGIKNCDTVRKARKWLEQNGQEFEFHDFREQGLAATTVNGWLEELGHAVVVNKRSTTWKQLTPAEQEKAMAEGAAEILCQHPTLIKRPVLDTGKQRYVGFKAEQYAEIF